MSWHNLICGRGDRLTTLKLNPTHQATHHVLAIKCISIIHSTSSCAGGCFLSLPHYKEWVARKNTYGSKCSNGQSSPLHQTQFLITFNSSHEKLTFISIKYLHSIKFLNGFNLLLLLL